MRKNPPSTSASTMFGGSSRARAISSAASARRGASASASASWSVPAVPPESCAQLEAILHLPSPPIGRQFPALARPASRYKKARAGCTHRRLGRRRRKDRRAGIHHARPSCYERKKSVAGSRAISNERELRLAFSSDDRSAGPQPVRAESLALAPVMAADTALQEIGRACLAH